MLVQNVCLHTLVKNSHLGFRDVDDFQGVYLKCNFEYFKICLSSKVVNTWSFLLLYKKLVYSTVQKVSKNNII